MPHVFTCSSYLTLWMKCCVLSSLQIIHFVNRDSVGLAKDFQTLGFLPQEIDIAPIAKALNETFGDEGTKSQLDFQVVPLFLKIMVCSF